MTCTDRHQSTVQHTPVVGQVVQAALDEAHADLAVGEPADQRAQQLLSLVDQALRQVDLKRTWLHTDRQTKFQSLVEKRFHFIFFFFFFTQ